MKAIVKKFLDAKEEAIRDSEKLRSQMLLLYALNNVIGSYIPKIPGMKKYLIGKMNNNRKLIDKIKKARSPLYNDLKINPKDPDFVNEQKVNEIRSLILDINRLNTDSVRRCNEIVTSFKSRIKGPDDKLLHLYKDIFGIVKGELDKNLKPTGKRELIYDQEKIMCRLHKEISGLQIFISKNERVFIVKKGKRNVLKEYRTIREVFDHLKEKAQKA